MPNPNDRPAILEMTDDELDALAEITPSDIERAQAEIKTPEIGWRALSEAEPEPPDEL